MTDPHSDSKRDIAPHSSPIGNEALIPQKLFTDDLPDASNSSDLDIDWSKKTQSDYRKSGLKPFDPWYLEQDAPDSNSLVRLLDESSPHTNRGYTSYRLGHFLEQEIEPRRLLLGPWLPERGLAMVYAPRGIGKTFFALNVAYAVATGGEFLGWKAERPRSVLYLDGEMVASEMQNRLRRISKHDKEECELRLLTPDFQEYGMPNLSESSGQRAIEGHVNLADLIIVDNIASLCRGGSENETEAWQPVQQWALALRAMGKSVLFVHHSGKSGKQRGTSSREDVLDTVVELKLPSDYVSDEGARFEVHFNKHRSFYGNEAKPFEARLTSNKEGEHEEWLVSPLAKGNYEQVVELFNTGVSQADISKRLNLDKSTVSRHVKRARAEGEITSKGE